MKELFLGTLRNIRSCFSPGVHIDTLIEKQRLEADTGILKLELTLSKFYDKLLSANKGSWAAYATALDKAIKSGEIDKARNIVFLGDGYDPSYNHEEYIKKAKASSITKLMD